MTDDTQSLKENENSAASPLLNFVYFYYLKPGAHHHIVETYCVYEKNPVRLDDAKVADLILKADQGDISPIGFEMKDLVWRRKGYLLFVVRDPKARLTGPDAVRFDNDKKGNHSFGPLKDAEPFPVDDPKNSSVSAVYCVNHRIRHGGGPLRQGDEEVFEVAFNFSPPPAFSHLETGTNTGP